MLLCPPHIQLPLAVLVHLKTLPSSPLEAAAVGFGDQGGRLVDGRVGRVCKHITNQEPLHHAADARSHLEDAQGLRGGGWSQSRDQGLPDLKI